MITAAEFRPASELPQSTLTREEELEGIINDQAAQLEVLRQGPMSAPRGQAPASLDVLAKMAELLQQNKELNEKLSKQERQIEDLISSLESLKEKLNEHEMRLDTHHNKIFELKYSIDEEEPQPKQKDRGEVLRLLLASRGGKMLAKDARHKLGISKSQFSQLLTTMKDQIESKPSTLNRRERMISLRKIV